MQVYLYSDHKTGGRLVGFYHEQLISKVLMVVMLHC